MITLLNKRTQIMKKQLLFIAALLAGTAYSQTYNNGGLSTGVTSKSGVTAPSGYTWSENQNFEGNTTESNTTAGYAITYSSTSASYFLADDFTVPAGESWTISNIDFFGYQTGYTGTTSPFNKVVVTIYSSDPSVSGAESVFGDDTTNRLSSSTDAKMYRIFNSQVPVLQAPVTTRKIWKVTANTPVTLTEGTYWVKYQFQNVVVANAGFAPPVTVVGVRALDGWNAKQHDAVSNSWINLIDQGSPTTAPDYPMDMPFVITYSSDLSNGEVIQYDNRVQIYPNPVKDEFRISNPGDMVISTVEVVDVTGKVVRVLQGSEVYDVSDLASGTYVIKISSNETTKITRLTKL
jgi:hypothetical protein